MNYYIFLKSGDYNPLKKTGRISYSIASLTGSSCPKNPASKKYHSPAMYNSFSKKGIALAETFFIEVPHYEYRYFNIQIKINYAEL